jgi:hypothetical protein
MTAATCHRLQGLEPDNLLAFLALLGLLRALEAAGQVQSGSEPFPRPRAAWDLGTAPLRPKLILPTKATREEIAEAAAKGILHLAKAHDFGEGNQPDLSYLYEDARSLLKENSGRAAIDDREKADLLAALMSDAAIKDDRNPEKAPIDPTPLCLMFGQGHQHFLERLRAVPADETPLQRGRGKSAKSVSPAESIAEALFEPWHRTDPTFSFRWDPEEDVRYALMAGDPTVAAYKGGTQHGANRLATIGLAALTLVPETRAGRVRPAILGGKSSAEGFSFAWPIWRDPATLSAIRALLGHPDLRRPNGTAHLGVDHVLIARRISVGKYMNFTRGRIQEAA